MPGLFDTHRGMTHMPQQPMGQKGQAVMQYLNDVASGRIAEQGLRQYGDAVQAGMQGNYGQFGGLLGDAMGSGLLAKGIASIPGFGLKTVYHGSPHKWDVPDISKIGTGEGAQAYGHGFYSAESPAVAKAYEPRDFWYEEQLLNNYNAASNASDWMGAEVYERAMMHETPDEMRKYFSDPENMFDAADIASANEAIDGVENLYKQRDVGAFYKLDIPDEDIPKYLDWDKPLSEQSEDVQKALKGANIPGSGFMADELFQIQDGGGKFYQALGSEMGMIPGEQWGDPAAAAEYLNSIGIRGIRYLDQGSRGAGEGTSNFVTFDPSRIKVLERN